MNKNDLKKISVSAVFCALGFIMTLLFKFKVSFLTFDFKDAIIAITSLLYGPVYGLISAAAVSLTELAISDTGLWGMLMNFISTGTFAFVCGITYKYKRSFSGAIMSVIFAVISVTAVMMAANLLITPIYMGVSRADVAKLIPTLLLPFNLAKSVTNASFLLIIYKPVTTALRKSGLVSRESAKSFTLDKKTAALTAAAVLVLIATVVYLIYGMHGSVQFFK